MLLLSNPHSMLISNFIEAGTVPSVFAIVFRVPSRVSGIVEQSVSIF